MSRVTKPATWSSDERRSDDKDQLHRDQRQFRKLRKLLRQIEHLELLTRQLNDEEEAKVARRDHYRTQLVQLASLYQNDELAQLIDAANHEEDDSTAAIDNSRVSQIEVELDDARDYVDNDPLDELVGKFQQLGRNQDEQVLGATNKFLKDDEPECCERVEATIQTSSSQRGVKETTTIITKSSQDDDCDEKRKKKKKKSAQAVKSVITFDVLNRRSVHVDLITTVDVCLESRLVVTGSRDTTLKVWKFSASNDTENEASCELAQNLGGHRNSITHVRFLPRSTFDQALASLKSTSSSDVKDELLVDQLLANEPSSNDSSSNDDRDIDLDLASKRSAAATRQLPLVLSSSLDCSFRLWSLLNEQTSCCLKEFYLYNPINYFDLKQTRLVFAMDAGKVEYWNNFKSSFVSKAYRDTERVVCVRFTETADDFYSMSQSGLFKVFNASSSSDIKLTKEVDLFEKINMSLTSPNFKSFELVGNVHIVALFDNKPFVVLFNINDDSFKLISTNSSYYGLTTCLVRNQTQLYLGAYSIDDGKSTINVFGVTENNEGIEYKFTLENPETDRRSISALCGASSGSVICSCSSVSLTIWFVAAPSTAATAAAAEKRLKHRAGLVRMCQVRESSFESESEVDWDESHAREDLTNRSVPAQAEQDDDEDEEEKAAEPAKSRCLIQ